MINLETAQKVSKYLLSKYKLVIVSNKLEIITQYSENNVENISIVSLDQLCDHIQTMNYTDLIDLLININTFEKNLNANKHNTDDAIEKMRGEVNDIKEMFKAFDSKALLNMKLSITSCHNSVLDLKSSIGEQSCSRVKKNLFEEISTLSNSVESGDNKMLNKISELTSHITKIDQRTAKIQDSIVLLGDVISLNK